jgi:predicted ATP-grasp superfamily ATP-dependent carboligase
MKNFIVVGKHNRVVVQVLLAIRSYSDSECIVLGGDETLVLRWSSLCSRHGYIGFDEGEDDHFVATVERLAGAMPHAVLIPADCEAARIINRVRDRLKIDTAPIPNMSTLDMFDDKWRFHGFCKEHGFRVPPTRFIGDKTALDFDAVAAELGTPFVVKPVNQSGSFGVHIVHTRAYYDEAIRNNKKYRFVPLIAQYYIDGTDMGLSLLSIRGKVSAYAVQKWSNSDAIFVPNAYLEQIVHDLCNISDYHGVMHVDARMEDKTGTVFLIESNPRFWASLDGPVWSGLNFVAESVGEAAPHEGVRALVAGRFPGNRHPLMWPSWWRVVLFDSGARGRMLRAMLFDLYLVSNFLGLLPSLAWSYVRRRVFPRPLTRPF